MPSETEDAAKRDKVHIRSDGCGKTARALQLNESVYLAKRLQARNTPLTWPMGRRCCIALRKD
jgi:hypothetical protein